MKNVWIASFALAALVSVSFFLILSMKVEQALAPNVAVLDRAINCRNDGGAFSERKVLICGTGSTAATMAKTDASTSMARSEPTGSTRKANG